MTITTSNFSLTWPEAERQWLDTGRAKLTNPEDSFLEGGSPYNSPRPTLPHFIKLPSGYGIYAWLNASSYQTVPLGPALIHIPGVMSGYSYSVTNDLLVLAPGFKPWEHLPATGTFFGKPVANIQPRPFPDSCYWRYLDPYGLLPLNLPDPTPFKLPYASGLLLRHLKLEK